MRFSSQTYVRFILIALAILVAGSYVLFQTRNLLRGPVIKITTPKNGEAVSQKLVEIQGVARNIVEIKLNDRDIVIDENGHFSEQLLLAPGYTIMSLSARDRFGRTTSRSLELFYRL